jgi:hypothetical protein
MRTLTSRLNAWALEALDRAESILLIAWLMLCENCILIESWGYLGPSGPSTPPPDPKGGLPFIAPTGIPPPACLFK